MGARTRVYPSVCVPDGISDRFEREPDRHAGGVWMNPRVGKTVLTLSAAGYWPGPRELIHPLCESDPQDGGRRTTQHEETEAHPRADHPQAGRGREAPG